MTIPHCHTDKRWSGSVFVCVLASKWSVCLLLCSSGLLFMHAASVPLCEWLRAVAVSPALKRLTLSSSSSEWGEVIWMASFPNQTTHWLKLRVDLRLPLYYRVESTPFTGSGVCLLCVGLQSVRGSGSMCVDFYLDGRGRPCCSWVESLERKGGDRGAEGTPKI